MPIIIFFIINIFLLTSIHANSLKECEWNNKKKTPCITIKKTPNTSPYNENVINKYVINKQDIINSGALDTNDVLKFISGLDLFQSGSKGQTTSLFTRGSESNHTLVLLNGIAINDQSSTDGLHDFGQDFIQTIQQIEIYKGPNGAHFGPSAIAGAINFITDIDYTNSVTLDIMNGKNSSISSNLTHITNNDWNLNLKGSLTQSETSSSIAGGNENDGVDNFQLNMNVVKWIKDNLKFYSTLYSRKTEANYDGSSTDEYGYLADNKMYALQGILEHQRKNIKNDFILHYHNYDREYENAGYLDKYYSESVVFKNSRTVKKNKKFSYGVGSEYKYDWGHFNNEGSYAASTKGDIENFGIFANTGYKFNDNQILSLYGRTDKNNSTDTNHSYKINFTQEFNQLSLGITHSTGLRNPSLFEMYGTDNYGINGNPNLEAEKSKINELNGRYNFSENIEFSSTVYRTRIFDRIETNSAYTTYENLNTDLNQEGLESELHLKKNSHDFMLFTNFSKSRTADGAVQSRRPDFSFGLNYLKKLDSIFFGPVNLNINYKHTGKYNDYNGSNNTYQKSTDIVNLVISKNFFNNILSLNITNLLNERYEKPATYSQDGRKLRLSLRKIY